MRTDQRTSTEFSEASTRRVLALAGEAVDLDTARGELLRLGENAL